jgi:hypothetical protein
VCSIAPPRTRDAPSGWHLHDGVPDVVLRAAQLTSFDLIVKVLQAQAAHDRQPATAGLTDQLHQAIDDLNTEQRGGPEPAGITLQAFGRPIPEA